MQLFFKKLGNTDLAILLNKDTFEPDPVVLAFKEDSTSKSTWMVPTLRSRPTATPFTFWYTDCHILLSTHSQCRGQKRDASTELLQRLQGYMEKQNVDFIWSDFKMSALSTVGDVVSDPEFSAPGNSFPWGLGALEEQYRERTRFLIMPKRPYEWSVDSRGCCKFDNAALGFGPCDQSTHLPVLLHQSAGPAQHHAQRTCTTKKNGTQASQT